MFKNTLIAAGLMVLVSGCATGPKFSWTDKGARLIIDPTGIKAEHYAMIQDALVRTDRFVILERPTEVGEIKAELSQVPSDNDKARWAVWAKKQGIGGVVVAHVQCYNKKPFLKGWKQYCHQYVAIMNPTSGDVLAAAEDTNEEDTGVGYQYIVPSWEDVVGQLSSKYERNRADNHERSLMADTNAKRLISSEPAKVELPKVELPKAPEVPSIPQTPAAPTAEAPKVESPKAETPKAEEPKKAEAKEAKQEEKEVAKEQKQEDKSNNGKHNGEEKKSETAQVAQAKKE